MEAFSCIDETFDVNLASEYRLSIQVGLDGFSFSILDDLRKKLLVFKHIPIHLSNYSFLIRKLTEIFEEEIIPGNSYKSVSVGLNTPVFTFATSNEMVIDESYIIGLNYWINKGSRTSSYITGLEGIKVIYSIPDDLFGFFNAHFNRPVFFHYSKPLILAYSDKIVQGVPSALIFRSSGNFTLLVHDGGRIVFANSFNFRYEEDFNFYIAASFQSLEANSNDINLYIAGDIKRDTVSFSYLKNKFKSVDFLKLSKTFQYSYTFGDIPQHSFLSVFNFEG